MVVGAGVAGLCTAYELEKAGYWAGTFGPAGVDQPGRTIASPGIDPLHHLAEARAHALRMDVDVGAIHVRHDDEVVGRVLANGRGVLCCATHARGLPGEWLGDRGAGAVPVLGVEPRSVSAAVCGCFGASGTAGVPWCRDHRARLRQEIDPSRFVACNDEVVRRDL